MILADKIIKLRKKNGWSQEELADKMDVSRQAVSKWEAAQTTPDLEKILQLSHLFGVTTDYLLKDELENEETEAGESEVPVRKVTLEQAKDYLEKRKDASVKIAFATFLCIFSVIPLLLLIGLSEFAGTLIPEQAAVVGGVVAVLVFVAIAVCIFIRVGFRSASYEFLEKEPFATEYGVTGMVKETQNSYRPTYMKYNIIGACICILSPIPIICSAFSENGLLGVIMLCVTILVAAVGVMFFIVGGVRWASMQRILKEGEFANRNKVSEAVSSIYWLAVTAVYLGVSFPTDAWGITWIVWPIAAVAFSVVERVYELRTNGKNDE